MRSLSVRARWDRSLAPKVEGWISRDFRWMVGSGFGGLVSGVLSGVGLSGGVSCWAVSVLAVVSVAIAPKKKIIRIRYETKFFLS